MTIPNYIPPPNNALPNGSIAPSHKKMSGTSHTLKRYRLSPSGTKSGDFSGEAVKKFKKKHEADKSGNTSTVAAPEDLNNHSSAGLKEQKKRALDQQETVQSRNARLVKEALALDRNSKAIKTSDLNSLFKLRNRGDGSLAAYNKIVAKFKNMSEKPVEVSLKELEERRKESPISIEAIQSQAKLFEAERKAKAWLAEQDKIPTRNMRLINEVIAGGSLGKLPNNSSLKLQDPADGRLIAYIDPDSLGKLLPNSLLELQEPNGKIIAHIEAENLRKLKLPEPDKKIQDAPNDGSVVAQSEPETLKDLKQVFFLELRAPDKSLIAYVDPQILSKQSLNTLLELRDPDDGSIIGYYKENTYGEKASGTMEQLIFDMATIFNVQDLFIRTKGSTIQIKATTSIQTKADATLTPGKPWEREVEAVYVKRRKVLRKQSAWDNRNILIKRSILGRRNIWIKRKIWQKGKEGITLLPTENDYLSRRGSFQVAHKGSSLADFLISNNPQFDDAQKNAFYQQRSALIDRPSLLRATMAAYLFGMFDAHLDNIRIDEQGHLKFFDNTRSLPHSNGFINWSTQLAPAFESDLLYVPGNLQILTKAEREMMQKELANYQNHFEEFEVFINSTDMAAKIKSLPVGWLDPQKALDAFEERIQNFEDALYNKKIITSTDLILACNPTTKFLIALNFVTIATSMRGFLNNANYPPLIHRQEALEMLGKKSLAELIHATKQHIRLTELYDFCMESGPEATVGVILKKVVTELLGNPIKDSKYIDEHEQEARDVETSIKDAAALDNKDLSTASSNFCYALTKLSYFDLHRKSPSGPILEDIQAELRGCRLEKPFLWIDTKKKELSLCYLNKEKKFIVNILDVKTKPGSIIIHELDLLELTTESTSDPILKDIKAKLQDYPPGKRFLWINTQKNEFSLFYRNKDNNLLVSKLNNEKRPHATIVETKTVSFEEFFELFPDNQYLDEELPEE